jgi:hypothetical protein
MSQIESITQETYRIFGTVYLNGPTEADALALQRVATCIEVTLSGYTAKEYLRAYHYTQDTVSRMRHVMRLKEASMCQPLVDETLEYLIDSFRDLNAVLLSLQSKDT